MNCPKCNKEYVCPCPSCRERESEKTPWIMVEDISSQGTSEDYQEACPVCGLSKSLDEWMDIEHEQYKKLKDV